MRTLYTAEEAGKRLRISETTVYRLFRAHKLKGVKLGRRLRFTEEEIMDFVERHREQVDPEQQAVSVINLSPTPKISFS